MHVGIIFNDELFKGKAVVAGVPHRRYGAAVGQREAGECLLLLFNAHVSQQASCGPAVAVPSASSIAGHQAQQRALASRLEPSAEVRAGVGVAARAPAVGCRVLAQGGWSSAGGVQPCPWKGKVSAASLVTLPVGSRFHIFSTPSRHRHGVGVAAPARRCQPCTVSTRPAIQRY